MLFPWTTKSSAALDAHKDRYIIIVNQFVLLCSACRYKRWALIALPTLTSVTAHSSATSCYRCEWRHLWRHFNLHTKRCIMQCYVGYLFGCLNDVLAHLNTISWKPFNRVCQNVTKCSLTLGLGISVYRIKTTWHPKTAKNRQKFSIIRLVIRKVLNTNYIRKQVGSAVIVRKDVSSQEQELIIEMRYPNVTWRIILPVYSFTTELRHICVVP